MMKTGQKRHRSKKRKKTSFLFQRQAVKIKHKLKFHKRLVKKGRFKGGAVARQISVLEKREIEKEKGSIGVIAVMYII